MQNGVVAYFGYGSLVNRTTHTTNIVEAFPARLNGWRRCWRPRADTSRFDVAILGARPMPDAVTEGLLVVDRADNLAAIDERERDYRRIALTATDIEIDGRLPPDCPLYVYQLDDKPGSGFGKQRILRSYLDAVLQGFRVEHGDGSVRRFIAETEAFEIGILDDRARPLYQRRVELSPVEQALFDDLLSHLPSVTI